MAEDRTGSPTLESAMTRRAALTLAPAAAAAGLMLPTLALSQGFRGTGPMSFSTAQDWIKTFFESADKIVSYYADPFVFEDVTLYQTITDRAELYAAFKPFENKDPNSLIGVHYFDVIRYDGGKVQNGRGMLRKERPDTYTEAEYAEYGLPILLGDYEYDEWGMMSWIWKAVHKGDFLGMPAAGKSTVTRGTTFHCYKNRKIVRDFTMWDLRHVAVQLGVIPPAVKFWQTAGHATLP
ncbi:MAG TPA: hypothetical protein VGI79_07505 [Caulobacteraceae bacterium]|jgi:steroid delta-isomerase-like uncharacterized protein